MTNEKSMEAQERISGIRYIDSPYVYVGKRGSYFIARTQGIVRHVSDMKSFLDWWIRVPWDVALDEERSVSLYSSG